MIDPSLSEITSLIPQRPPMQMIDRLLSVSENGARASLFITDDNIFAEMGVFGEAGLIEFIAQTAAAFTGYKKIINKTPVKEGYIGAIKNLSVYGLPRVSSEIFSEIEIINEIVGFTIITGKVSLENKLLIECEMRILVSD